MPKVTVLVPAYNSEAYLRECLDSITRQTLEDIEVICLNDGSTDSTLDIMREFEAKDSRFTVVDKPNSGYGSTMNLGLDMAHADFVTSLESDDLFPPTAVEDMYNFIIENDLEHCKADAEDFHDEGGKRVFSLNPATFNTAGYEKVYAPSEDPGRWYNRPGQPGMYRMSFLKENGIRYNETPGASFQDAGFWAQTVFCGKRVRYLAKSCYLIRRDNPNSSEVDSSKVYTICEEFDFIRDRALHMESADHEKSLKATTLFAYKCYYWNCTRIKRSDLRAFIERFASDMRLYESLGGLDYSYFSDEDAADLKKLLADPVAYYYENWVMQDEVWKAADYLVRENEALRRELDEVYGSIRYRVGTAITAPGRLLRRFK